MTSQPPDVLRAILTKAREDYAGLWEIPIVLRTMGVGDPIRGAMVGVMTLLTRGLLELVWGNPNPDPAMPVKDCDREDVLAQTSFWSEDMPFDGRTVWICATAKGERWADTDADL